MCFGYESSAVSPFSLGASEQPFDAYFLWQVERKKKKKMYRYTFLFYCWFCFSLPYFNDLVAPVRSQKSSLIYITFPWGEGMRKKMGTGG